MTSSFNPRANITNALEVPDRSVSIKPPPRRPASTQDSKPTPAVIEPPAKSTSPSEQAAESSSGGEEAMTKPVSEPTPKQSRQRSARSSTPNQELESVVPGVRNGNLRIVTVTIPALARNILERESKASKQSRGQIVMAALRATYTEIRMDFALETNETPGLFGVPRVVKRRHDLDDPRSIPLYISESEARGLGDLKKEVSLSISAIITEALERHYRD